MDCKLVFLLACVALAYGLPTGVESSHVTAIQSDEQVRATVDSYLDSLFIPVNTAADPSLVVDSETAGHDAAHIRERRRAKKCYNYPKRDRFGRVTFKRICR